MLNREKQEGRYRPPEAHYECVGFVAIAPADDGWPSAFLVRPTIAELVAELATERYKSRCTPDLEIAILCRVLAPGIQIGYYEKEAAHLELLDFDIWPEELRIEAERLAEFELCFMCRHPTDDLIGDSMDGKFQLYTPDQAERNYRSVFIVSPLGRRVLSRLARHALSLVGYPLEQTNAELDQLGLGEGLVKIWIDFKFKRHLRDAGQGRHGSRSSSSRGSSNGNGRDEQSEKSFRT